MEYALITGASSGIGKAMATELAKRNINVILVGRRITELQEVKQELEQKYAITAVTKQIDLSIKEDVIKLHQDCLKYPVKYVINCAGFGKVGAFVDIELSQELTMIETNIIGLHILTKLFAQSMKEGKILNVSSMVAFIPTPLMATYAATKAYVSSFSESINYELKIQGSKVRIATLCPGPVDTEFSKVAGAHFSKGLEGITASKCAKEAISNLLKGKRRTVPSFKMKFLIFLLKIVPIVWVLPFAYRMQKKK